MNDANNGLIDIVDPAVPIMAEANGWLWVAGAIVIVLLVAVGLYVLWKYKLPAYRALQQLRKVQQKMHAGEFTPHESVLMVALELRHGLGVRRLRADNFPERCSKMDQARWPEFMQEMDALLYQHNTDLNTDKLDHLFSQTEHWLRRYSRRSALKKIVA